MKKKLLILTICLLAVAIIACFAACSENTSRLPIKTDLKGATLSDNGGMAVKYGNYIYFINGFAGEEAENTFGEVVKGSICRVTLDDQGVPDYKSVKIVVPKNAFGEDTTYGGIYVIGNYIYYNTTSVEKDSSRHYKHGEGVLMRTTLDGSTTEIVEKFDDNDVSMYAGDNSKFLAYFIDNYGYAYNPETKKIDLLTETNRVNPKDDEKKQTAVAYKFGGDYLVYTMYNYGDEANYSADYIVWAYNLKTGKKTEIMNSDIYNGNKDRTVLYKTTLYDIVPTADGFILYYSKAGNDKGQNDGFYSYAFNGDNPKFIAANEVRYTHETSVNAYTKFFRLANGYTVAFNSDKFDVFQANGEKVMAEGIPLRLKFEKTVTVADVGETDTEVYAYYLIESQFYYIKLFEKNGTEYTVASTDAVGFFSGECDKTYTSYDFIGNTIYYFNDNMEDNAYYYVIPAFDTITASTDVKTGKILGIITDQDIVKMIYKE